MNRKELKRVKRRIPALKPVYSRREPGSARPFTVPGYPWTPLAFILAAVALVANTIVTQPRRAAIGMGVVLLGAPVYLAWRRSGGESRATSAIDPLRP